METKKDNRKKSSQTKKKAGINEVSVQNTKKSIHSRSNDWPIFGLCHFLRDNVSVDNSKVTKRDIVFIIGFWLSICLAAIIAGVVIG